MDNRPIVVLQLIAVLIVGLLIGFFLADNGRAAIWCEHTIRAQTK